MDDWRTALRTEIISRLHEQGGTTIAEDAWREACEAWLGLCGEAAGYQKNMRAMGEKPDPATVRRRTVAELIVEILDSAFSPTGLS